MKRLYSALAIPAALSLIAMSAHAASLTAGSTIQVSSNASDFNLSVFPGKAGYDDGGLDGSPDSGVFGDGTVLDYRFYDSPGNVLNSYADGGAGLIPMAASPTANLNGAGEHWAVVWTTNDPGTNFTGGDPANFPAPTLTFARSANITGTIDISTLTDGSLYFPHGTFINSWNLALTMSGPGQPDILANVGQPNGPGTNMAWITDFTFADAGAYNTITYTYTNTDTDGSRARFMGVILDGAANFGADDSDGDFLNDLWEDQYFGNNNGSVEPEDLTPTGGLGDFDSDGATDRQEHDNASNPKVADTDSDGLNDGDEINTYLSDPNVMDTDGDGLDDGPEVNDHGTSPTLADTDGDSLSDGEELALGLDGFITNPLDPDTDHDGVRDDADAAPTDPTNDSDGDGISNEDETDTYGTDPLVTDTDGDGLEDREEIEAGLDGFVTNPLNRDTDGDAIIDGLEFSLGSDPTDRRSIPTGGTADLVAGTSTQVSGNASAFNISVFPGAAGYDDAGLDGSPNADVFGDGTVVDYRFFDSPDETINSYADGGAGLIGMPTSSPDNINGAGESWADLWTTNDPGNNFDTPPPNFNNTVNTFARTANITGTIDISRMVSGTLYFAHGSFFDAWDIALVMSGPGQPDVMINFGENPPDTINMAWITNFAFFNAGGYDTITYTYTNNDVDGSRARFMGVIIDGEIADAPALRITEITYSPADNLVTLTWNSRVGELFAVRVSTDMTDWTADLDDGVEADAGETTSRSFNTSGLPTADGELFFRVEKQ